MYVKPTSAMGHIHKSAAAHIRRASLSLRRAVRPDAARRLR